MIEADLITKVRAKIGKIGTDKGEVDDEDIVAQYGWILIRIAEKITVRELRYITSVANQRGYIVPNTVLRIPYVYKWDNVDESYLTVSDLGVSHRPSSGFVTNEYYHHPSMWTIKMMKKHRGLPRINFEFNPITRELRIDPHPTITGNRYYYNSVEKSKWVLNDIPEDFEGLLIVGCAWKSIEQVAMKRSNLGGIMREGGLVTYPATEIKLISEMYEKQFKTDLRIKALIYAR